ncbi:hypothetical protein PVA45_06250 [Entomospira entomophila]|uniref:Uncharacterized protein n=1 Tax=Entomospira entomophila TaxID=2719988 RepID=A0A968KRV2_9SPIO|nr:hypothetical protein [Entomospira entomophilus]NIZ41099.1 hypothetical protein [Entomospira entomophilus]WDI35307.1 hypothetical protein PVA45_06250 [Entomospira entomophilus]
MTTNQPATQAKRKNHKSSSYRYDSRKNTSKESTGKTPVGSLKHQGKSKNKRKDLLPPPNGGIQRISSRPPYQKRDFPKIQISMQSIDIQCPLCHKIIGNEKSILKFGDSANPAHFNCVVQWIENREQLEKNQYILYLGAGKFAIANKQTRQKNSIPNIVRTFVLNEQNSSITPQWERDLAITPECLVILSRENKEQQS